MIKNRVTERQAAKEITRRYLESVQGHHYVIEDILKKLISDENYLPQRVYTLVCYNNRKWNVYIEFDGDSGIRLTDVSHEEARIFAAWMVERYARLCGEMPEIRLPDDSAVDVYDLLSGRYKKLLAINENIRLRDLWGTQIMGGIHVELYAPKLEVYNISIPTDAVVDWSCWNYHTSEDAPRHGISFFPSVAVYN